MATIFNFMQFDIKNGLHFPYCTEIRRRLEVEESYPVRKFRFLGEFLSYSCVLYKHVLGITSPTLGI